MVKIAFLGAGSTVFAKNVLGDCLNVPSMREAQIVLVDLDPQRLHDSEVMLKNINRTLGAGATITSCLARDARTGLAGADFAEKRTGHMT